MAVLENLSEEEAFLFAILQDISGIDQVEFLSYSAEYEETDGCFRARPYQWPIWRDRSMYSIEASGRDVGKTKGIINNAFAFPFCYPGQEMVIVAPEFIHIQPVAQAIVQMFDSCRLGKEMLKKKKGGATTTKPFVMLFENGSVIRGKIPHRDAKALKGGHATILHFDEAQDLLATAWTEAQSTMKRGRKNAFWKCHGVTRGVQDDFWKRSQPGSGWKLFKTTAMNRPTWNAEEKAWNEQEYGSQDDPDYRRNILGEHGDNTSVIFVQNRFMKNVDDNPESDFNTQQFSYCRITDEMLLENGGDPIGFLIKDIPAPPVEYGTTFWLGSDIGFSRDPSEVIVFAEGVPSQELRKYREQNQKIVPAQKQTVLTLIARVKMHRVSAPDQARVFDWLVEHYGNVKALSIDATGAGEPIVQFLERDFEHAAKRVKGYKFGSRVLVGYREVNEDEDLYTDEEDKDSEIWKAPDIYAIDVMRTLIDQGRFWVPFDKEIVNGFIGHTVSSIEFDQYGNRRMSKGPNSHIFDALRMAVVGWRLNTIEQLTKKTPQSSVIDVPVFYDELGSGFVDDW